MFREKQKLSLSVGFAVNEEQVQKLKNGNMVLKEVPTNKPLPPPQNYTLDNLLEAGVNLEEVNTVLMDSRSSLAGEQIFGADTDNFSDEVNENA